MGKAKVTYSSTDGEGMKKGNYCLQGNQASYTRPCDK